VCARERESESVCVCVCERERGLCEREVGVPSSLPSWRAITVATKKVDIRLPGKGNSNCLGARPVY